MKIKTQDLTGAALDWAVAHVERKFNKGPWEDFRLIDGKIHLRGCGAVLNAVYDPSTDWAQGGPISEQNGIQAHVNEARTEWLASCWGYSSFQYGPTELVAKNALLRGQQNG